jgi:putative peptide zinc metalloprotease protein
MSEPSQLGEAVIGLLRPTTGLSLLGEYQGSGFTEPRFLVRRGDGQVIQLSRLLYLVAGAITDAAVGGDGAAGANVVAARVSPEFGREVTAANVRYLVATKLAPLGVVIAAAPVETGAAVPVQAGVPAPAAAPGLPAEAAPPAPRVNLLLGLKVRGVLLPARAANAVGRALAWLHFPPLVVLVLAGFAAFEGWLFGVHGAIGPLLGILDDPVLFFAVAGLTLVSLLFHEFGHASACRYGGARPGVIGFGLYLIWPSLYTDVTDAYRLSRAGRLRTDLGGVYFNAIFVVILGACYAATGQPLFLAAAFLDNFQILQQLFPLVRMDGYFILGDVAGIPDLLGLLGPIMASVLPGRRARRAGARAPTLRRGPRLLVTAWVLVAIPLLAAALGYTLWNLPVLVRTASRSFSSGATAARADFSAGHPAAGLAAGLNVVLLLIPAAGLAYLLARIVARGVIRASRLRGRTAALGVLGALAGVAGVTLAVVAVTRSGPAPASAAANRAQAAAWVAQQVSPGAVVSCDPATCGQLQRDGFPAARLMTLGPATQNPLASGVVIGTPSVRDEFGTRLATVYAPLVLAGFGSGANRVEVREIAPDGAAALAAKISAQRASLRSAGQQLLRNRTVQASPAARAALLAGRVDARLLANLSVLSSQQSIMLVAFGDAPPGASSTVPLREVQLSATSAAGRSAILAFLHAQRGTYRPAVFAAASDGSGQSVVTARFDAPDPLLG